MLSFIGRLIVQYSIFMVFFCFTFSSEIWLLFGFLHMRFVCLVRKLIGKLSVLVSVKFGIGCCCFIDKFCE